MINLKTEKDHEATDKFDTTNYHIAKVDSNGLIYKEYLFEIKKDGSHLIVFTYLDSKTMPISLDQLNKNQSAISWFLDLVKDNITISCFHNPNGAAYGSAYKNPVTNEYEYLNEEYWINGKRVKNEEEINLIKNKGQQ